MHLEEVAISQARPALCEDKQVTCQPFNINISY